MGYSTRGRQIRFDEDTSIWFGIKKMTWGSGMDTPWIVYRKEAIHSAGEVREEVVARCDTHENALMLHTAKEDEFLELYPECEVLSKREWLEEINTNKETD